MAESSESTEIAREGADGHTDEKQRQRDGQDFERCEGRYSRSDDHGWSRYRDY